MTTQQGYCFDITADKPIPPQPKGRGAIVIRVNVMLKDLGQTTSSESPEPDQTTSSESPEPDQTTSSESPESSKPPKPPKPRPPNYQKIKDKIIEVLTDPKKLFGEETAEKIAAKAVHNWKCFHPPPKTTTNRWSDWNDFCWSDWDG